MKIKLKPISRQVVVITGASSGIGRQTALDFAAHGARVVAAARDDQGLESVVREIRRNGGEAIAVNCDVANFDEVQAVAETAVLEFGGIDTWVNNAAVLVHATFEETTLEEFRRVLDVNLLGQVHGARAALPHLRLSGGALICVSSVEARVSMPLHSAYAASKHGVEGFLDSLRRELKHDKVPISVTNIMPATINTPLFSHARTKTGKYPQGAPPIYQPENVSKAILYAAEHPVRELIVGGAGKMMIMGQKNSPKLMDFTLSRIGFTAQNTRQLKSAAAPDNLFRAATGDGRAQGNFSGSAKSLSLYTMLETKPLLSALLAVGSIGAIGAVGSLLMRSSRNNNGRLAADNHLNTYNEINENRDNLETGGNLEDGDEYVYSETLIVIDNSPDLIGQNPFSDGL